jgi:dTMP kinase
VAGFFISFEGIEGSGKTTQIALLSRILQEQGREVVVTREPGGTAVGQAVRGILLQPDFSSLAPLPELLLCLADRAQHVHEVIAPALAAGAVVLSDRFVDSTVAYQGYGRGRDLALIAQLNALVCGSYLPQLTFLLECPVEVGLTRANSRSKVSACGEPRRTADRFEAEPVGFHERVHKGYAEIARSAPERVVVMEATRSSEQIHAEIRAMVLARMAEAAL